MELRPITQVEKERARHGVSRQRVHQKKRKAAGICLNCAAPAWRNNFCFRHSVRMKFYGQGILGFADRYSVSFNAFILGALARYTRILEDEGFAVDAIKEPEKMIELSGMGVWAKRRLKRKVLEVIQWLDDKAIRERMKAEAQHVEKRN